MERLVTKNKNKYKTLRNLISNESNLEDSLLFSMKTYRINDEKCLSGRKQTFHVRLIVSLQ